MLSSGEDVQLATLWPQPAQPDLGRRRTRRGLGADEDQVSCIGQLSNGHLTEVVEPLDRLQAYASFKAGRECFGQRLRAGGRGDAAAACAPALAEPGPRGGGSPALACSGPCVLSRSCRRNGPSGRQRARARLDAGNGLPGEIRRYDHGGRTTGRTAIAAATTSVASALRSAPEEHSGPRWRQSAPVRRCRDWRGASKRA